MATGNSKGEGLQLHMAKVEACSDPGATQPFAPIGITFHELRPGIEDAWAYILSLDLYPRTDQGKSEHAGGGQGDAQGNVEGGTEADTETDLG